MIRITTHADGSCTVVTIDGRATEPDLGEIRRVRKAVSGEVVLNLRGLDVCSPTGIKLLRDWLNAGARLRDATPFLEMTLTEPQN